MEIARYQDCFNQLYNQIASTNYNSGINCLASCDALCCPRSGLHEPRVGTFIIFLPFEFEYLCQKTGLAIRDDYFFWEEIKINSTETIAVPWARECPFIKKNICQIYPFRPFDCRCFPLYANYKQHSLTINLSTKCPNYELVSADFSRLIETTWHELSWLLPDDWWRLAEKLEKNVFIEGQESTWSISKSEPLDDD